MQLPLEWSAESGVPPQMVLRHFCEWTVSGAFPPGTLVTSTGREVPLLSIFEWAYALMHEGQIFIRGWSSHLDPAEALSRLQSILVTAENVWKFCEASGTFPPPSLLSGWRRALALISKEKELSPPPCPHAQDNAERLHARDCALGQINTMRSMLGGLRGERTHFGPRREGNEPISFEFWEPKWTRARQFAQTDTERCGDVELQQQLDTLNAGWDALVAEESQKPPVTTDSPAENMSVRLRITKATRTVILDGKEILLSEQTLKLLCLLAERARDSAPPVNNRDIEGCLWGNNVSTLVRPSRDAIRSLRDALAAGSNADSVRDLITNRPHMGYSLALMASEIVFVN
jgi:DNA-binding winged helix-turn-helix (wHTH) protein